MTTFYYVSTLLAHGPQAIYKKDELIKALNNFDYKPDSWLGINVTMYSGVTDIHWVERNNWKNLYINDDAGITPLSKQELKCLYKQAQTWFDQQLTLENKAVRWSINHPDDLDNNPYGNRWDGQMQNLAQSNMLGNPCSFHVVHENPTTNNKHWGPKPTSHSTYQAWGHGRTNHDQSTFARDNYWAKVQTKELTKEYPNNIIRHQNRKYNRNHTEAFPVFDDPEYELSRHSTGWKYSSKARHQYNQHFGKTKTFNKRQQSHLFNDWTAQDEYEAHGGDYYAPCWWADQPDPNLTPMSNLSKTQRWDNEHSAFNVNYIKLKKG